MNARMSRHRRDGDRSLCRQQDLSSPPCPDVDKDVDAQSLTARFSNPGWIGKNSPEATTPLLIVIIILSLSFSLTLSREFLFPSLHLFWLRLRLENRLEEKGWNESDVGRDAEGRRASSRILLHRHPRCRRWTAMGCCTNLLLSSSMSEGGVSTSQKCQG